MKGKKMIVGVQGSSNFSDYKGFLRGMGVALSGMAADDQHFYIYSAGPSKLNSMAMEFVNLSERGMRSRGKKIKMYKVPPSWITEHISEINYFAYFSTDSDKNSRLVYDAQEHNVETGIFKY